MIKLQSILKESILQEYKSTTCVNTQLLLEGKISRLEYSNHIQTLEEGLMDILKKGKDAVVKWFKENILTKLVTFIKKAAKGVKEELDIIIFGMKKLLALVTKFKDKHPVLFKVIVIGLFIVVLLVISTASAQAQDPAGMGYTTNQLNSMIGLLDQNSTSMEAAGFNLMDIKMATAYLNDLKDGTVDVAYSSNVKEIASNIEGVFSSLMSDAKGEGAEAESAIRIIMNAFEYGKGIVFK